MNKRFLMPVLALLLLLLTPAALAAEEPTAERTSYGMQVNADGSVTQDGKLICAVYDGDGRMIGVELVSKPDEILVYCDVNEARRVSVFAVNEETLAPVAEPAETTMEAPTELIHVHTWNAGTVTQEATCQETGTKRYTCTSSDCNEQPNATTEEALPAIGHNWGDWVKANDTDHTRVCGNDSNHTETAAHTWDNGVVTTKPTSTAEGVKTYTCGDCGVTKTEVLPVVTEPDVWFTQTGTASNPYYYVNWKAAELADNEYYYVNGNCTWVKTNNPYSLTSILNGATENQDIVIGKGVYRGTIETLYTLEDAILVENVDAPTVTLVGQASGQYLAEASIDDTGYSYYLTFKNPDGTALYSNQKSATGLFDMAPYSGCSAEVFLMGGITISEDATQMTLKRTGIAAVDSFTYCTAPTETAEVGTYNELLAALKKGGSVKMMADITYANTMSVNSGPAATLDLNGYTLSVGYLEVTNAKELTINGTVENSALVGTSTYGYAVQAYKDAILTINGGTYSGHGGVRCSQNSTSARSLSVSNAVITVETTTDDKRAVEAYACDSVTLTNVDVSSNSCSALQVNKCGVLTVDGGSYISTCTFDGTNSGSGAIFVYNTPTVSICDVTAKSEQQALYVSGGSNVTVTGGNYTATSTNSVMGVGVDITDCGEVDISGITANGSYGALKVYRSTEVTVSNSMLSTTAIEATSNYPLDAYMNTTLTLTGVTAVGDATAAKLQDGTTLIVTDSTFTASGEKSRALLVADWDTATLTHITVNNQNGHNQGALALTDCTKAILQGNSQINHSVSNLLASGAGLQLSSCPDVLIAGATITGNMYLGDNTVVITGGTFHVDPSAYVDTNTCTVTDNGDGTWTVKENSI